MTIATGDLAEQSAARDFERDWQAVRANGNIQYAPVDLPKPPELPGWLKALNEFLAMVWNAITGFLGAIGKAVGLSASTIIWILLAIIIALALLLAWRILSPAVRLRKQADDAEEAWTPGSAAALGLLEDADRLAAAGRFGEATHLLLQRSVVQLREARPGLLEPSSTAREIAALPALADGARSAFAVMAERVERSLFALRALSAEDWHAAREAYSAFALAAPRNSGA